MYNLRYYKYISILMYTLNITGWTYLPYFINFKSADIVIYWYL